MSKTNDEWVVQGRITYAASGEPAVGLRVTVMDADLFIDDLLGEAVTDAAGGYRITYGPAQFRDLIESAPDLYLVVRDREGRFLATSLESPVRNASRAETIDLQIAGAVPPVSKAVRIERTGAVLTVILSRSERRNAVDRETALALAEAFREFAADPEAKVAVLFGEGGNFCAGADLKAISTGEGNRADPEGDGPMGPTRMTLSKPVIAAVAGYAVAGGLELALWCDLRVVERSAQLGVFCRRWGVPLIDGGTVRLPRIVGLGRALDMILTGRPVGAEEAMHIGLADRIVDDGQARAAAEALAAEIAAFPQICMRSDRLSAYEQASLSIEQALRNEFRHGMQVIRSRETLEGAQRFAQGAGRHGRFS
jgi:enoyl-CoA hydratase